NRFHVLLTAPTPRVDLLGQSGDNDVDRKGLVPAEDPFELVGRLAVVILPEFIDIGLASASALLLDLLLNGLTDYLLQVHGLQLSTGINHQGLKLGILPVLIGDLPEDVL